jgi:hypothetical protein
MGAEIGFPAPGPAPRLAADANPAFAPYLGRWEGDDDYGAYLILQSVEVKPRYVIFKVGFSEYSGERLTWMTDYPFELDYELHGCIAYRPFPTGSDGSWATLKSATEMEVETVYSTHETTVTRRFLLRKRGEEAVDRSLESAAHGSTAP